jgi:acyl carrier protein
VEIALETCPGVESAVALVMNRPARSLAAAVVVASSVSTEEILRVAATQVPHYMVPVTLVRVPGWPLTANGKVDRRRLQELAEADQQPAAVLDVLRGDLEHELAAIWREVLSVDVVPRMANFFALGGDSLLATEIVSRIRSRYGVAFSLRELFAAPTLAGVAAVLNPMVEDFEEGQF